MPSVTTMASFFFFYWYGDPRDLHSFPTRRSSDVETLAERLAQHLIQKFSLPQIRISVSKPGAIRGSQNVGVEILRGAPSTETEKVYFSFGSNIDPLANLKKGL